MIEEEIKKRREEKIKKIEALCEQLQISISAEEMILSNGIIKKVIYYADNEKYGENK